MAYIFTSILALPAEEKHLNSSASEWSCQPQGSCLSFELQLHFVYIVQTHISRRYLWQLVAEKWGMELFWQAENGKVVTTLFFSQCLMHVSMPIHSCKPQILISSYCTSHCLFALRSLPCPSPKNSFLFILASYLPARMASGRHWQETGGWEVRRSQILFAGPLSLFWASFSYSGSSSPSDSPSLQGPCQSQPWDSLSLWFWWHHPFPVSFKPSW